MDFSDTVFNGLDGQGFRGWVTVVKGQVQLGVIGIKMKTEVIFMRNVTKRESVYCEGNGAKHRILELRGKFSEVALVTETHWMESVGEV